MKIISNSLTLTTNMDQWLVSFFLLLFGSAALSNVVPNDKTAVYSYNTVVLSGSPEKSQQFSAIGIRCNVSVARSSANQLVILIANVAVGRANEVLHRISPNEIPLKFSPSEIYSTNLTIPFAVQFQEDGLIEKIQFDQGECEWSKNFKRGLATMFQIKKLPISGHVAETNENDQVGTVYQELEPTFTGVCKAIYDYQATKGNERNDLVVNITKTIDYNSCENGLAPYFGISTHRAFECKECNHPQHNLHRDIIYKYNLVIDDGNNYIIREGIADGIVRFTPLGRDADAATVLHNRTLVLQRIDSGANKISLGRRAMKWELPTSNLFDKLQTIRENKNLDIPITYYELFENGLNYIHHARHGIKKIVRLMSGGPTGEETELILAEIPLVQRALETVTYPQLEVLAREFSSNRRERKLFFDHVAITATNPCIKFVLDASTKKLISANETCELLPTIAAHIANPNVFLMDYVLDFCKSPHVRQNDQLMDACFLAWGSMVAKTCAAGPYQLPKAPKLFCSKENREKYVNAVDEILQEIDEEERKISLVTALGNMAIKEVIPVVEKLIWSRGSEELSNLLRVKAVYALIPLAKIDSELVRKTLISLFFKAEENSEVRISAFDVLIASKSRQQLYEIIAARLQYEQDVTVGAYVYSTFKTLANISHPCWKEVSSHAAFALKLIDERRDTSAWIASKTLIEGDMDYLDVNSFNRWLSLGDEGSLVPSRISVQFENFLAGVTTNLYKLAFYGNNTSHLIENLFGPSALFSEKSLLERMVDLGAPKRNRGESKIADKLGIESQREPTFWAHIARTFMDFQQRNYFINKDTIVNALKSMSKVGSHFKTDFTAEKTLMPLRVYLQLPIDSGFEAVLHVQTPIQVALDVVAEVKSSQESSQQIFDVDLKLRGHFASKTVATLGVWLPSEESIIKVGLETALIANPVVSSTAHLAINKTGFSLSIQPGKNIKSSSTQELIHFHTKPFTGIEKPFQFKPLEEWIEIIHVMSPKRIELPIIGNALVLRVEHEDFWDDRATVYNYLTENPPYGVLAFWWLTAQANWREYSLVRESLPMPELQYEMDWQYEAAESDPEKRYRNFGYNLWKEVAGWSDAPLDCLYQNGLRRSSQSGENSNSDSSSGESKENQSSQESVKLMKKMRASSEESSNEDFAQKILTFAEESGILRIPKKVHASLMQRSSHLPGSNLFERLVHSHGGNAEVETSTIGKGVVTYKLNAEAKINIQGLTKGYRAELVWKKHREDLRKTARMVVRPLGNGRQKWMCLDSEFLDEKPPCLFGTNIPDMSRAKLSTKVRLTVGNSCSQTDEDIELWVNARKSNEQVSQSLRHDNRPWFYKQCEKDSKAKRPMSYACIEKTKDMAKLDLIEATVRCKHCGVHNTTEHIRDFLVSQLYAHMTRNPLAVNPPKQMKVVVKFRPHIPVMDVRVERPHETLNFQQIFYGDLVPFVRRPSISKTATHRALNYFSDNTLTPTCTIGNGFVDDFNNRTFNFSERRGCEFLLSRDSSSANLFSVLTRREQGNKVLTVRQLKNVIEISPRSKPDVTINGKKFSMKDKTILFIKDNNYGPKLLGFVVKTSTLYKVVLTFNRISVLFDGDFTQIITSNLWRHKLRGVCGEFNPREHNVFRGPRKCTYTHANDFAQSYALPEKSCPRMQPKTAQNCPGQAGHKNGRTMMSMEKGGCYQMRPLVVERKADSTICVSNNNVKVCDDECEATETENQLLDMHCMNYASYSSIESFNNAVRELYVTLAQSGAKSMEFLPWPSILVKQRYPIPRSCAPKN